MEQSKHPAAHYSKGIDPIGSAAGVSRATGARPAENQRSSREKKRVPWRGNQVLVDSGQHIAATTINRKDLSYLAQFVDDLYSEDGHVRDDALSVLVGVSATVAAVLEKAMDSGVIRITGDRLPTPVDIHYAARNNMERFEAYVRCHIDLLGKLFASGVRVSVSIPSGADAGHRADAVAEPVTVRVVEMPARHTVTTVNYDAVGDIVGSVTIDKDMV